MHDNIWQIQITKAVSMQVFWLLPPLLLYCLAMGAVHVPKLNVILNLICRQYQLAGDTGGKPQLISSHPQIGDDNAMCQTAEVHSLLARFMLYANLISGTLCAITSPHLGALSDRYGRRFILAITALGMLFGDIITLTAASFPDTIPVWWILVEYAFGGLAGSFIATMAIIQSYAADCTPAAERSVYFGYLHGCMYAGIAIGPILGAWIIQAAGDILTIFYIAFVCHLWFIVFVTSFVPESLTIGQQLLARERHRVDLAKQTRKPWVAILNVANIFRPLKILLPSHDVVEPPIQRNLLLLSTTDTIVFGVTLGSASLVVMYSEYTFKWGTFESSVFVSIVNSCRVTLLVFGLPLISRAFRRFQSLRSGDTWSTSSDSFDISTIRIAVFFDVLGYIGYAVSPSGPFFTLSGIIASAGGVASATLQSALTTHVSHERTGELLGAMSFLHAAARVSVPAALQLVYGLTVARAPSTFFWCLAMTFTAAFAASLGIRPRR